MFTLNLRRAFLYRLIILGIGVLAAILFIKIESAHSLTSPQDPSVQTVITLVSDGTESFDPAPADQPGEDLDDNNGLVRNSDLITYRIEHTLNDADDTNNVITASLDDHAIWAEIPAECLTTASDGVNPDSSISADGKTLVCNVGDMDEGTKIIIYPTAKASGANTDLINTSTCSSSDANINAGGLATGECSGPIVTEITAGFGVTVSKTLGGLPDIPDPDANKADESDYVPNFDALGPNGEPGVALTYHIQVAYIPGSEFLNPAYTTLEITDTWEAVTTNLGNIAQGNALLYDYGPNGASGACSIVTGGGSVTCDQGGTSGSPVAGQPVIIDLAGLTPAAPVGNTIVTTSMQIWIPETDYVSVPGDIYDIDNTATVTAGGLGSPMLSASGAPNPNSETASQDFTVIVPGPGPWAAMKTFEGGFSKKLGAKQASPGEIIETTLYLGHTSSTPISSGLCDTIDTAVFEFAGVDPVGIQKNAITNETSSSNWGVAHNPDLRIVYGGGVTGLLDGTQYGIVIEYSDSANVPDAFSSGCPDTDNWVSDYTTLPGAPASVTKVRMMWDTNYPSLTTEFAPASTFAAMMSFNLKIRDDVGLVGGETLSNTSALYRPDWMGGDTNSWYAPGATGFPASISDKYDCESDPASPLYTFNGNLCDRVEIVAATMAVSKSTDSTIVSLGDVVDWKLQPSTSGSTAAPVELTLTDTLPPNFIYVSDDCVAVYTGCIVDTTTAGTVIFTLPGVVVADDLPEITLTSVVGSGVVNGDYENEVVLSSDNTILNDSKPSSLKSTATVRVVAPEGMAVLKTVEDGVNEITIAQGDAGYLANAITYTLEYTNLGGSDFNTGQIIDVLPHNLDGADFTYRYPESLFSGLWDFESVVVANGEVIEYSTDDPTTIQPEPCHPNNWPAGDFFGSGNTLLDTVCIQGLIDAGGVPSLTEAGTGITTWVAGTPPTLDPTVTAIRFTTEPFVAGDPTRVIELSIAPYGNVADDLYCNSFTGQFNQALDEFSNDVCIPVVAGSISGSVWWDLDSSAGPTNSDGEPTIEGVEIQLLDANGDPVLDADGNPITTTTDADGNYLFENLPSGEYQVAAVFAGGDQTYDNDGAGNNNSGPINLYGPNNPEDGVDPASYTDVDDVEEVNFSYVGPGSLSGTLWIDADNDGVQDGDETPLAGVELIVTWTDPVTGATTEFTVTTDADGFYSLKGLPLGDYTIAVNSDTVPEEYAQVFEEDGTVDGLQTIVLTEANPDSPNNDFAYNNDEESLADTGQNLRLAIATALSIVFAALYTGLLSKKQPSQQLKNILD